VSTKSTKTGVMCSALLPKTVRKTMHVFSAFFSGSCHESCSLAATLYSKLHKSTLCGVCFSKQSQKLAMISRAQICRIHTSEARDKRSPVVMPSWPSLHTNSFIFTRITRIGTHGSLCASQITRRPVHVLSSFVVAKYIDALTMKNQNPFRKTNTGSS